MSIPHLLDNLSEDSRLDTVLNHYIIPDIQKLYIATGYFYISGFELLLNGFTNLKKSNRFKEDLIQIIISPRTDKLTKEVLELALEKPKYKEIIIQDIVQSIELDCNLSLRETIEIVVDLIQNKILKIHLYSKDFFHAKAYIAKTVSYTSNNMAMENYCTIVGSSNFSIGGLHSNRELNLSVRDKPYFDSFEKWFLNLWENETEDLNPLLLQVYKETLRKSNIEAKQASSEVFLSPLDLLLYLIQYFIGKLDNEDLEANDQLVEFQRIGAENILNKLERLSGAIISDSVGLGKTFTAGEVVKRSIKKGQRVLILTPPHTVLEQWKDTLSKFFHLEESPSLVFFSQGKFSLMHPMEIGDLFRGKFDLVVVDEAHRARNKDSKLYQNLNHVHPYGQRMKILLLTATPFNNRISDLENLIKLCTTETILTNAGLTLKSFSELEDFSKQLKNGKSISEIESNPKYIRNKQLVKDILNSIMLLRMRTTIRNRYGKITIAGKPLVFEDPIVRKVSYSYSNEFLELFSELPRFLDSLVLPHILIAKNGNSTALSGLYKLLLFKRIESSLYAFGNSLDRIIKRELELKERILANGIEITVREYKVEKDPDLYEVEDSEDSTLPPIEYTEEVVLEWIEKDISLIQDFVLKFLLPHRKEKSNPLSIVDPKMNVFLKILQEPGYKKALVFTAFKNTIEYIQYQLNEQKKANQFSLNFEVVSGEDKNSRTLDEKLNRFAPKARNISSDVLKDEIDILISTDVLSEGVNLQDADVLINFDLPWNPMRIVQRIGRVNRIGSENKIKVYNMSPDNTLDDFLNLLLILETKVKMVTSLLGKEMAIISSESEEILVEDIGEEIKKRQNVSTISDYEKLSTSRSFFGDLEGETEEDYFRSYLFFSAQENKIREKDFKQIQSLSKQNVVYTIFSTNPKEMYCFYEIFGKSGDYLDVLSRICIHSQIDSNSKVLSKEKYPFQVFTKNQMNLAGYTKYQITNLEEFHSLELSNESLFHNNLETRKKQYSIVSLNSRSQAIRGSQAIVYTYLKDLLREDDHLIGDNFREVLVQKNLVSKIEDLKKILVLFKLDNKRLYELGKRIEKKGVSKLEYTKFAEELSNFYDNVILQDPNFRGVLYKENQIFGKKIAMICI